MENKDFEEMRNQISILKDKLQKQEIVTRQMLRASMKNKKNEINVQGLKQFLTGILAIMTWTGIYFTGLVPFSPQLIAATCLMMVFCIAGTWYCHTPINERDLFTENVATVASAFARVRMRYTTWITYVTPTLIIPWLTWVCYEYVDILGLQGNARFVVIVPLLAAAFIGFLIGYSWHRKVVKACREIEDQLKEE